MSKNAWIIWALILTAPGAVGLGYHFAQQNALDDRIAAAAQRVDENPAADEYVEMYHKWFALEPEAKAENPWGQDPYGGPDIQQRLKDGQADCLTADLADLDKGLKHYPDELADTLYGLGWRRDVEQYRSECEKAEMILIGSIFLIAGGGVILAGGLGKILFSLCFGKGKTKEQDESTETISEQPSPEIKEKPPLTAIRSQPQSDVDKIIAANSDDNDSEDNKAAEKVEAERPGYFQTNKKSEQADKAPLKAETTDTPLPALSELNESTTAVAEKPKDSYFGWAVDPDEDPTLENMMTTEPLTKELNDLTEEMSAIREFAAQQQDQVRKLQDGYDWMIIRRFCMRIVRCVDNIDDRIGHLDEAADELAMCLEDIRDELIFALESSGVEQFNPDLNMPYKGLEKYAEAVRQRMTTDDESLVGCIAEVARPGYQYLISEDDVKVVRCAQVKLYDAKQS
ncbi:MAG: hypothetical protein ACYSUT_00115 [Planctomycetota bacterium]|jgi:molecular chaperone GrpE (heat shock protein)